MSEPQPHDLGQSSNPLDDHCEPQQNVDPWKKRNLLSLDGGGIRGYWTLLVLERLMEYIADIELKKEDAGDSSFAPEPYPENVSHLPPSEGKSDGCRRFLPCHYFDLICGSSTGALIAIMLGRLRMTVSDCLQEYRKLGQGVFGRPRHFTQLRFGFIHREKFPASGLEQVLQSVTNRRSEQTEPGTGRPRFPMRYGPCETFVTTIRTRGPEPEPVSELYKIRTHRFDCRDFQPPRTTTRTNTGFSRPSRVGTEHQEATDIEIWEVARAATAATFYFKPFRIRANNGMEWLYEDAGFANHNNPVNLGKKEIEAMHGKGSVGIVVSVGTARTNERIGEGIVRKVKRIGDNATDTEKAHEEMEYMAVSEKFAYYRLNEPGGLKIPLDHWRPKQRKIPKTKITLSRNNPGSKTTRIMEDAFHKWAGNVQRVKYFQECAEELVKCRRLRTADTGRWERYAVISEYDCPRRCELTLENRQKFKKHLLDEHQMGEDEINARLHTHVRRWKYQEAS